MFSPVLAIATSNLRTPALIGGALLGYCIIMCTNPAHAGFRDGARAVRRYSGLWIVPGFFGFCAAVFQIAQRVYFSFVLPPGDRPSFMWARAAWRDKDYWLSGSDESLWWLPRDEFLAGLRHSVGPAFEMVASIFNCLIATFPISAVAAVLLLINRGGHHGVLIRALQKRFGFLGWIAHIAIMICAIAAIAKPLLYAAPQVLGLSGPSAAAWFQWSPVVVWLSFLFEYLFGVFIQTYLILLAYIWVRGLTFTHAHLVDFAIRRFSSVAKWAAVILIFSSVFIDAPLILKNFAQFADWFPEREVFTVRLSIARAGLAVIALVFATMQITLIFHSESWRAAFRDHWDFVRRHSGSLVWFILIAALHCVALHTLDSAVARGLGEGTTLWVAWTFIFPWLAALVAGWLLASWVCVFKHCASPSHSAASQTLFKF